MKQHCPSCGEETLFVEKAVYDGFTKVGDRLTCTSCGAERESAEDDADTTEEILDASPSALPSIFGEDDRPEAVTIEGLGEEMVMCRYCVNYTMNAYTQRCGLHLKTVQATDSCDKFERRETET